MSPMRPPKNSATRRRLTQWALGFAICIVGSGCCDQPAKPAVNTTWTGPTESIDAVVQQINHNSAAVPTLWTRLTYTARIVDEKKQTQAASGDGVLAYSRPGSLLLYGNKDVIGQLFQVGSNENEFWVKIRRTNDSSDFYWGHQANVGKPCCRSLPFDPQLVIEVLGVSLFNTNFLEEPVPVMRFDNENGGAYVLDFNRRYPDRWVVQKEVWFSREKKTPIKVLLFDENGRVILQAKLSNHGPVELPNQPAERWPVVSRHYDLLFPDNGNQISFDFDEPTTQHTFRRVTIPNRSTFVRPEKIANDQVIQIDKDCN